jgi:hypothetical protein
MCVFCDQTISSETILQINKFGEKKSHVNSSNERAVSLTWSVWEAILSSSSQQHPLLLITTAFSPPHHNSILSFSSQQHPFLSELGGRAFSARPKKNESKKCEKNPSRKEKSVNLRFLLLWPHYTRSLVPDRVGTKMHYPIFAKTKI